MKNPSRNLSRISPGYPAIMSAHSEEWFLEAEVKEEEEEEVEDPECRRRFAHASGTKMPPWTRQ